MQDVIIILTVMNLDAEINMSWEKRKLHINDNWFCQVCNSYNKVYDKKLKAIIKECNKCKNKPKPLYELLKGK
jgi:hypothetical protein